MAGKKSDFTLTKLDDLFTTQAQREEEKLSKIRDIPLGLIDDFPDHPFKVRDDEDMLQLIESIRDRGVITPANSIAHAYATQLLIWETIVGERDANFNHKAASGCSNVKDVVNAAHPLRSKIFSYYDSMVASIQKHTVVPSFCNRSAGSAKTLELEWDGSKYTTTLTDTNNVLSNYSFSASQRWRSGCKCG